MTKQQTIETFASVFNSSEKTFTQKLVAYDALAKSLGLKMLHKIEDGIEKFEFKKTEYSKKLIAVV